MKLKKKYLLNRDVIVLENDYYFDNRGYLWTSYHKNHLSKIFFHDKFSVSKKNVFRGIHYDFKTTKLLSCVLGKIFLIIIDMRAKSKTYLKYKTWILDEKKKLSVMIPPGFGNGYYVLSKNACFNYKLSYPGSYNDYDKQSTLKWHDPILKKIKWPFKKPIVSSRDQ